MTEVQSGKPGQKTAKALHEEHEDGHEGHEEEQGNSGTGNTRGSRFEIPDIACRRFRDDEFFDRFALCPEQLKNLSWPVTCGLKTYPAT